MSFKEKYKKIRSLTNIELELIEQKMTADIQIREPLNSAVKNFLVSPSKRIRPVLAILYAKAANETLTDEQLELLSVIELIHSASLVHDDIIDNSELRRGNKTLSAEFDNRLAVISGDYILATAMNKLAKLNSSEILINISKTIAQMCLGEINQNFDRFKKTTIDEYIEKTKDKTAYLFESALVCCMLLSKNSHNIENISKLGMDIGIAFQIRDDILNMTDTDTSKPVNSDIKEGIYNAPVILGDENDNYASGIEKTKDLLNNYIKSAKKQIETLPENQYKTALEEFLELLNNV